MQLGKESEWFWTGNIIDTRAVGEGGKCYEFRITTVLSRVAYGTFIFVENLLKTSVHEAPTRCISQSMSTSNHLLPPRNIYSLHRNFSPYVRILYFSPAKQCWKVVLLYQRKRKLLFLPPCLFLEWNYILCALVIKNSVSNSCVNEPFVSCGWRTSEASASIFHAQLKWFILHTCCTIYYFSTCFFAISDSRYYYVANHK